MNVTVSLTSRVLGARKQMCLRVLVCKDVTTDLIIGLPSIKHFDLLPILNDHITTIPCCEICSNVEVAAAASDTERRRDTPIARDATERGDTFDKEGNALQGVEAIPIQHSSYTGEMATLFAEINSVTDNFDRPTYSDPSELIQALQGLHLSEVLEFDDDGADEEGQNDIDISRMKEGSDNKDYTMGGSEKLQNALTDLITEYDDIFSYSVKGRSMDVPPMEFTVDERSWESSGSRRLRDRSRSKNRSLSRH